MGIETQDKKKLMNYINGNQTSYFLKSHFKEHAGVLALYTLLTFILTYPAIFKIGKCIPGGGDAFQWIRILWYTPIAIFNPNLTKLTHDYLIFYPNGIPVSPFQSAFNQAAAYLLSSVVELDVAYTMLCLFSFVFGAYGTYLLVNYLLDDKLPSFIAGIVFAFSPYHFAHLLGHFGAVSIEWIPFCALYLMKMFREGGVKNSLFAGIFFILVAMSDLQYMMFMGIFVMLLFFYEIYISLTDDNNNNYKNSFLIIFKKYFLFGIVSLIGLIPLTMENILTATSDNNFLKLDPSEAVMYSTDLLSFFIPSVLHPIFSNLVTDINSNFSGNYAENTTFIGYTVLLLSIFAICKIKGNKYVKFWSISALFFSLMSLGPLLHINGNTSFTVFNTTIPLPYVALYHSIPFLNNCRTVGRFFVIASLSFSVLTGFGISELFKSIKSHKKMVAVIISGLIIFEYLAIPFPVTSVNKPEFYDEISQDKNNYALLEIPSTLVYEAGSSISYYQTIHGKPVVGGWAARFPSTARDFELNTPVIRELTYLRSFTTDILNQDVNQIGTSVLNYYNIPYVILHTNYMNKRQVNSVETFIQKTLNAERTVYENDSLIVYHINKEPVKSFMSLKDNWYKIEKQNGVPTRWISNNATLLIYSNEKVDKKLTLRLRSHHNSKKVKVLFENYSLEKTIPTNFIDIEVPLSLEKGENIITFSTEDKCFSPAQIGKSKDDREISFAIQNITLS